MAGPVPTAFARPAEPSVGASTRSRKPGNATGLLLTLGIASLLLAAGWLLMFSTFMPYDDEGYVLISLRHFASSGTLYDRVYTQYGPFFFLLTDALSRLLRFDWNSDTGRLLALVCWWGSAASCAALVARSTKSLACTAFTLSATFGYLLVNIREPGHPGSIIVLLVAVAAWVGTEWEIAERPAAAAAIGVIGAALTFTKINVGGFLLIAASFWLLLRTTWVGLRGMAVVAFCLALAGLPWALMRQMLSKPSVFQFATNVSLGLFSVGMAARTTARPAASRRSIGAFVVAAACVSVATIGLIVMRGTSPYGLLRGVLLDPLGHPFISLTSVHWLRGSSYLAGGAMVLTVVACRSPRPVIVAYAVALTRVLVAIGVAYFAAIRPGELGRFGMSVGIGVAGLCALPMRFDAAGVADARARQWLALVLGVQSLHAFPTAGSQVSWGSFLVVPLVSLAVRDAWLWWLPARWRATRRITLATSLAVISIGVAIAAHMMSGAFGQYRHGEQLGLPGAERMSLPPQTVLTLRTLAENAHVHAGMLFTEPGMFSFNLWAERPTPTMANATAWHALLTPEAQREIITRLRQDQRAVVIRRPRSRADGELHEYLERNFEPAFTLNDYVFTVHAGRHIAPLSTARMSQPVAGSVVLDLTLARMALPISRIEVRQVEASSSRVVFRLSSGATTLDAIPLGGDGWPSGTAQPLGWPAVLSSSITQLRVRFAGQLPPSGNLVCLLFSGERQIGTAQVLR